MACLDDIVDWAVLRVSCRTRNAVVNAIHPNEPTYRDIEVILSERGPYYRGSRGLLIPGGGIVARRELLAGMMSIFSGYRDPTKA